MLSIDNAIQDRISHVAYLMAESQGFASGRDQENWRAAQNIVTEELLEKMAQMKSPRCLSDSPVDQAIEARMNDLSYAMAESRDFAPGHELDDWVQALRQVEGEIHARINSDLSPQEQARPQAVPA